MVAPGITWLCECIIVSMTMVSPESTVSTGGWALLNQPHWVVSMVAGSTQSLPLLSVAVTTAWASAARGAARTAAAASDSVIIVSFVMVSSRQDGGSITTAASADPSRQRRPGVADRTAGGQAPTTWTARFGGTSTVCLRATYRSTSSQIGGPWVPSFTLAQPATVYCPAGSIGLPLLRWVMALMRLP